MPKACVLHVLCLFYWCRYQLMTLRIHNIQFPTDVNTVCLLLSGNWNRQKYFPVLSLWLKETKGLNCFELEIRMIFISLLCCWTFPRPTAHKIALLLYFESDISQFRNLNSNIRILKTLIVTLDFSRWYKDSESDLTLCQPVHTYL